MSDDKGEGKQRLLDTKAALDATISDSVGISDSNMGLVHTGRQNRALFVFSKITAHNLSTIELVEKGLETGLLDHFSIATLGRASIDASLMTMYISEPGLDADAWNLRRHILYLHDLTNRKRFLSPLRERSQFAFFENYEEMKESLRSKIGEFASRLDFNSEQISKFREGQLVFHSGARGAVREAGWDSEDFEFLQAYFSAFVHTHPVSFMRVEDQEVSFSDPSSFQLFLCAFVLETITRYTELVNDRMREFSEPSTGDPLGHVG
ncbi:hypothetical protein FJ960_03465 [Mesorhizobium sp. B2-3-11]|uniref:hypothetical protein n=1 Tax=Mesorhizobium sp. B2-3-11 TaxID=2589953 RepID=UPI00112CC53B|nr:hypothetical protein [Mesorhizobium sp. B2-3-11]TPM09817.1 hypothetical protein FJ960_03465 [Mesorhizobium sp. B2-3-11]